MEKYFVYILFSPSLNVFYKGFSTDVEKRLEYHYTNKHTFTSKAKDWVIVYVCEFESKQKALIEEKRLKKLNRNSLEKLIANQQ